MGYAALQRRFAALRGPQKTRLMGAVAIGELKRAVPGRKTGLTAASWQVASATDTSATLSGSIVNLWLDEGTGLYGPRHARITPRAARALAFHVGSAKSLRLSGRPRAGSAGRGATLVVVRSTRGMRARPFIARSLASATGKLGTDVVVKIWNGAA